MTSSVLTNAAHSHMQQAIAVSRSLIPQVGRHLYLPRQEWSCQVMALAVEPCTTVLMYSFSKNAAYRTHATAPTACIAHALGRPSKEGLRQARGPSAPH